MRTCVIIPTYKNPRTLRAVVLGARERCEAVIVIDDGSPEPATALLSEVDGVHVVTHVHNRGKGAALCTGFAEAARLGFTHAISMDADGQHLAEDLPLLVEAARAEPSALILGARDLIAGGAGKGSRFGRANSNFWIWVETGLKLPDTQTGLRCYPLASIGALDLRSTGYDLEVEVIVKAAWAGVPVTSVPVGVRYFTGADRVSHLRPVRDFIRIGWLNARLVALRVCLPALVLRLLVSRGYHAQPWRARIRAALREAFVREPGSSSRIAVSIALGLFVGIAPFWGAQGALAVVGAHVLGLSKPLAFVASNVSFPLMIPPILYASLVLGRVALGGSSGAPYAASLELSSADVSAWLIGSFLLATLVALAGGFVSFLCVTTLRRIRPEAG